MPMVNLNGGSYEARSSYVGAQRCLNLYPEIVPQSSGEPHQTVDYPTPGLRLVTTAPNAGNIRGMYFSSQSDVYVVAYDTLYQVSPTLVWTARGTFPPATVYLAFPVCMADNGLSLIITTGEGGYYTYNFTTLAFAFVAHPGGGTASAWTCAYVDTFFLIDQWAPIGTPNFWVSDSLSTVFDPLSFASKSSRADPLLCVAVVYRNVWLIGVSSVEIWYNAGGAGGALGFPFALQPGAFIDYGCYTRFSVAQIDNAIFWLSRQRAGNFVVVRGEGLTAKRISTNAIEDMLNTAALAGTDCAAYSYCYSQSGHTFYVMNFVDLDKTFVWDDTTQLWHERCWTDPGTSLQHRHRGAVAVEFGGDLLVGDWQNGKLYYFDTARYTDESAPITRVRTFPHMENQGLARVHYRRFSLDMQCGTIPSGSPTISLDWSDDAGATFGTAVSQTLGTAGQTATSPQWRRLGYARNRVFRVTTSAAMKTVLTGAVVDVADFDQPPLKSAQQTAALLKQALAQ